MTLQLKRVGDVSEQIRGVTYSKEDASLAPQSGYLPVLRAGNITDEGLLFDDLVFVAKNRISDKQRIRRHDIVVAASSGSLDVVGKAAQATMDFEGSFGAFCKVLRPTRAVDPSYFGQFFKTREYRRIVSSLAAGVNINNLRSEHLDEILLPLPEPAEQHRIADVLDRADALRAKRRAALALLDTLTQSIFLELFGNPVANPFGWPMKTLGEVGLLDRGVSKHRPRNAPELLGGMHPLIQTGEIANSDGYVRSYITTYSDLGLRQSKLWPAGTLCITIAANIAKAGILGFDACFPDSVVGFRAEDPATVEFVRIWLSLLQKSLEDSAPESAQKNINLAILRNLNIPAPPVSLQHDFARRVAAVEKLKAAQRASLAELDALFASLQHRAFRGEL